MNDELIDPGLNGDNPNENFYAAPVPNSTAVLVLGICSIVGCILYGLPGLICGIISIVLHKKAKQVYETNRSKYEMSYKNARAGYICAIIGVSLSSLYLLFVIGMFVYLLLALPSIH